MYDDEFHIDPRPLYERDQVVVEEELYMLHREMQKLYDRTPWWRFIMRAEFQGSLVVLRIMIEWLRLGKPNNLMVIMSKKKKGGPHA